MDLLKSAELCKNSWIDSVETVQGQLFCSLCYSPMFTNLMNSQDFGFYIACTLIFVDNFGLRFSNRSKLCDHVFSLLITIIILFWLLFLKKDSTSDDSEDNEVNIVNKFEKSKVI